ncbi:MAG: N-acetylmuramoyl-L-alanine amidase [Prevotella sp.]|nr:N-acetylmuramoyl-L-alanine amidase [Prevotella sp.]
MRRINLIVIHCSATRVTQEFSVKDLEACHLARGYKTIGYHYYITKDGKVHRCRPEEMAGAHARRYNAHSIGICYEGGLDANGETDDTRTPAQKRTLVALLRSLKVDYPDAQILGHRDLPWVKKRCPCFDARSEYHSLQPLVLEQ